MTETTSDRSPLVLERPETWPLRRFFAGPLLVVRWVAVLAATAVWLIVVPLAAAAGELRRGNTS
jgi:hypothetical protein